MDWNVENGHVFWTENNELMAETTFEHLENGEVNIDHTYVNPILRGQGVAGKMMEVVAAFLREQKLTTVATCSYANAWLQKNKAAYGDILSVNFDNSVIACRTDGKH